MGVPHTCKHVSVDPKRTTGTCPMYFINRLTVLGPTGAEPRRKVMRGREGGREGGGEEDEEGGRGDGGREGHEKDVIILKISGEGKCKVESFSGS